MKSLQSRQVCSYKEGVVEVGIRELRAGLSRWLARVRAGEELIVTDRGSPVARVTPIDQSSSFDRLVAAGLVTPARPRADRRSPKPVRAGSVVSDLVADQRR
jgi:prevent-host-death family protein